MPGGPRGTGGHGRLPARHGESLDALARAARPLALAPARDGGVNAIALAPLNGFVPRFGVPAETTLAEARAAGLEPVVVACTRRSRSTSTVPRTTSCCSPCHERARHLLPKVFIPLTKLCRDVCHYCTFAQPPRRGERAYMTLDEVLEVARAGERAGCREALFTLGDKPELRYRAAREELAALGCETTIEYLARLRGLVLEETSLLPHLEPRRADRGRLRAAAAGRRRRWG